MSSGGKRPGAGRKKKAPSVTISFRITPEQAELYKAHQRELKGEFIALLERRRSAE